MPTAATAEPAADSERGAHQLDDAAGVVGAEERERRDDEDVDDRDREAGLDEDLEPVAAADAR